MVSSLDNWDGSLSGTVNQQSTRITDLSVSSPGTSKTAIQDERISIKHGWQDMVTSLDVNRMNDAPNLNQPLSRDGLVQRPSLLSIVTPQNNITTSPSSPTRRNLSFMPVASSPLHLKEFGMSPVASTPIVLTLPNPVTSRDPLVDLDSLELISTHTADGEGEDEGEVEEVIVVHDMLSTYSRSASRTYQEQDLPHQGAYSHLFTPPPEEDSRSVNHLFTPCSSPKQTQEPSRVHHQPRSRRVIMSHIRVPPLKRPRSDYRPLLPTSSSIVSRRRVPSGPPPTLQEAIQASFQHNANIGSFPYDRLKKEKRKLTKRNEDGAKINIAGPSFVPDPTGRTFHFGPANIAQPKKRMKRPFVDDDDWGAPPKKRPRPISESIVVDLTITDDDERGREPKAKPTPKQMSSNPIPKPLPKPRPAKKSKFIHAAYNSETDVVTLYLEDIRPVPLEVLTLNTQSLRQSLGDGVNANKEVSALRAKGDRSTRFNINPTRQNGSRPCFLSIVANPSYSTKDTVEEMSVGGVIWELPEEEIEKEVIEISSESDASWKKKLPQKHPNLPSTLTSQALPIHPKISLKNERQKKPRESHESRQQPKQRRQPTGVDRSSSTFGDSIISPPPPRAIPSSTKVKLATQYPKKVRESQHSQQQQPRKKKQTSGNDINGLSTTFGTPHKRVVTPSLPPPQSTPPASLVRSPHSVRPSLNGQNIDSGSDYPNGAMPSAKVLGKRRAVSPTSISATTTPQRRLHDPVSSPYFGASIHDIQLSSRRSSTSTPIHDAYVVHNSDFNAFIDYPSTISPAAQVNPANLNHAPSLSSPYNHVDTLASLYGQSSSSQSQSVNRVGSAVNASHHQLSSSNTNAPTPSHTLVYNSQPQPGSGSGSRGDSLFSSTNSLYNDIELPGDQHDYQYDHEPQRQYYATIDNLLSSSLVTNHSEGQYAYETIDPTLLGGGEVVVEPGLEMDMDLIDTELDAVGMGMGLQLEKEFDDQVQQKDNSQLGSDFGVSRESSPSSSSTDASSSSGSAQAKKTHASLQSVPVDDEEPGKEEIYRRQLPPRIRTKRVIPDMISHDDIDLLASKTARSKRRSSFSSASSAPDADKSGSDSETDDDESDVGKPTIRKPTIRKPTIRKPTIRQPTVRKPIPKSVVKAQISPKPSRTRSTSPPIEPKLKLSQVDKNQEWLLDKVDAYCHQCRRKTFYAKTTCSACQKKFCVRCYAFRYPEHQFDLNDEEYSCPACEGFCNCTACCRKRGEPYVGVRTCDVVPDSIPLLAQRQRNTKRVNLGSKTNLPPPAKAIPTTTIPKGVTQAWGSLYSVTGEKIGNCFYDPSVTKVVFAPATTPIMTTITDVAQQVATAAPNDEPKIPQVRKKRRVFVGMVQPSWGYSKPKIKLLKSEPYAKRSYNAMPRYYVGKKKYLFYQIEDEGSPLTSMDDDDDDEEVGKPDGTDVGGKSFSPDSLGDGDVARAILLGLNACGVAAVEVPAT
ncbi:hypothetical protein BYT27DRAFT_7186391 [Phlegmacium glaucopus]|nr:hypothetical protein BYT27DRAFT_7186391 [Phlegmacium glaucopus]